MQRRGFLKLGLFGGALLAVGGVGLAAWPTRRTYAPRRPLEHINDAVFPVLAAIAARVVLVPGADPVEVAHRVDRMIGLAADETAGDFNKLLGLIESGLAGLVLDGRASPFTHLDGAAQDAALYAFRDSRFLLRRSGYQAVKKLCAAAHYGQESTWADVGYPGPPVIPLDLDLDPPRAAMQQGSAATTNASAKVAP